MTPTIQASSSSQGYWAVSRMMDHALSAKANRPQHQGAARSNTTSPIRASSASQEYWNAARATDTVRPMHPAQMAIANRPLDHGTSMSTITPVTRANAQLVLDTPVGVEYSPWWLNEVGTKTRDSTSAIPVSVDSLLISALRHSSQLRVYSDTPLIRETAVTEADAAFDWTSFMEVRWDDTSDPVGNTLTTGGAPRFRDNNFNYSVGRRRRNAQGGEFEVAQQFGYQYNNSLFFVPANQGTTRLTLSYTQPLLRGAGQVYNTSLTVLAQIDSKVARDEFSRQLQSHLLEVTRAYWGLYLERATLLQKRRLLRRAQEILAELERRQELDAVRSQVVRTRAAVEARRAEILRSEMAVKNAESSIRSLTNDPHLGVSDAEELIPQDLPLRTFTPVKLEQAMSTAMQLRPQVSKAMQKVKAACVRMNMSKNEILPMLNVVLETYASGLRGNSDTAGAWVDQFSLGEPGYAVGLQYELPVWNRAARARLQRRRLEARQLQNQFQTTIAEIQLEVAAAVRELFTSFREMEAKYRAMTAAGTEVEYMEERWRLLAGEERAASLVLEDLLNAHVRLTVEEYGFLKAGLTYNLAQMSYKQAVGTLLQDERVSVVRGFECNLPNQKSVKLDEFTRHPKPVKTPQAVKSSEFIPRPAPFDVPPPVNLDSVLQPEPIEVPPAVNLDSVLQPEPIEVPPAVNLDSVLQPEPIEVPPAVLKD